MQSPRSAWRWATHRRRRERKNRKSRTGLPSAPTSDSKERLRPDRGGRRRSGLPRENPLCETLQRSTMTTAPSSACQDALYAVQSRYNKMGVVIRTATKLLGDCKAGNIGREIKKLQAESGSGLKEENEDLKRQIAELQVTQATPRSRNRAAAELGTPISTRSAKRSSSQVM